MLVRVKAPNWGETVLPVLSIEKKGLKWLWWWSWSYDDVCVL